MMQLRGLWARYFVAIFIVAFAAALRVWPLQALGSTLTWLTFYPAVMVVAVYGGLYAGLLATALACLTATFLWPMLVAQPFIKNPADWLGMSVFILTGCMISAVAEAMRRAQTRALRAQEQLRAASLYTRSLIEASLDPLVTISAAGKITDANQAAEKVTGCGLSELIATDFSDYFTEPDKARAGYMQVFAQGFVTDYPLALRHRDGHITDVLYNASVYRDETGRVLGVFAAARDVTERKRAAQELAQLSLQNRLILNSAGEGIYGLDIDGLCTFVNPAALQLLGFRADELTGQHSHFMFHHTKPDGSPYPEEECPVQAAYKQGEIHRGIDLYWRKNGGSFPVEFVSTPMLSDGKITGAVVAFRDITEQKLAEEQLLRSKHSLAEAQRIAHLGSWELDLVKNVLTWSDEIYRMLEIDPENFTVSYDTFLNAVHPDDRERVSHAYACSIESKIPYDIVHRLRMKDGRVKFVNEKCETYYGEDGKPKRSVGTVHDITEQIKMEEELKRYRDHLEEQVQQRTVELVMARDAAEAANRAKSVFLSSMNHELRTPLNAILGFSSLMRKNLLLPQALRENIDIIHRSGETLLMLINDVLEMSRIEVGRMQVENAPFDLGALVRDVSDMMHMHAREKGLQLLIDQSSDFPRYIRGDEVRLRQVLIKLVGNALKFTRQGGVTVRFGMKPDVTPQRLLIEVEDSGIGINEADQQRIFDPFVQLDKMETQAGTGLGLTITRQFVELMGGSITVQSSPGTGSVFRVELPVEKVDASIVPMPEKVEAGDVTGLAPGQSEYRILIVEDQRENQLLLSRLMTNIGFEVRVAQNGQSGVELFQSWHPHLIWMDWRMPVMDGLEATRRIRELPGGRDVKIVAVTASVFAEQRAEVLSAGMDGFVRKPYRFNEIYECLGRQLGVQYTYAGPTDEEDAAEVVLTDKMLAVLQPSLRAELRRALESLDEVRIDAAIGQVADTKLRKTLTYLAGNFDYPAILKALHAA
ncbi:MAG: PAS domain S-box protein [Gallionella sp.]|nr:PAS domain S-box protein [Gallionella sp.]